MRHVVLDIGNVLIRWESERPFRALIPDERRRRWFLSEVCSPAWNLQQDAGRPWEDAEAELIALFPEEERLIRAYRAFWHEMVPGDIPEAVATAEALIAAGHDVTMLTNFAPDTFEEARARFPVLTRSRGVTVSGAVGMVKPDRAIYDHHARTYALDAAATLFLDDSAANVDAARAAGWRAEQVTEPDLRPLLSRHGIEVD